MTRFLGDCEATLRAELTDDLVAAAVVGSLATGAATPRSDVDLLVVVEDGVDPGNITGAGRALVALAPECPLRGLEAVIYRRRHIAAPTHPVRYALNVNAGPAMQTSVSSEGEAAFWFLLDLSAAREHARPLVGPPPSVLIGTIDDREVRKALVDSLHWHAQHHDAGLNAVLNACRAWHWCVERSWVSKPEAGRWAVEHGGPEIVAAALAAREAERPAPLDLSAARAFLDQVEALVGGAA